jgi:hypothetical protein
LRGLGWWRRRGAGRVRELEDRRRLRVSTPQRYIAAQFRLARWAQCCWAFQHFYEAHYKLCFSGPFIYIFGL